MQDGNAPSTCTSSHFFFFRGGWLTIGHSFSFTAPWSQTIPMLVCLLEFWFFFSHPHDTWVSACRDQPDQHMVRGAPEITCHGLETFQISYCCVLFPRLHKVMGSLLPRRGREEKKKLPCMLLCSWKFLFMCFTFHVCVRITHSALEDAMKLCMAVLCLRQAHVIHK